MPVTIGALRESAPHETRVSLVPEVAGKLAQTGARVLIEHGAGTRAQFPDASTRTCEWADSADAVLAQADVVLTVQPLDASSRSAAEARAPWSSGFMQPHARKAEVKALRDAAHHQLRDGAAAAHLARAVDGRAVVAGRHRRLQGGADRGRTRSPKFLPMLTTAAGTIRPSQVLVIGAGVAGLQAIATARRLGAVVEAYDVRSATKEQVEVARREVRRYRRQRRRRGGYARELTAEEKAQAAGSARLAHRRRRRRGHDRRRARARRRRKIISRAAVERMRPGAVIVDIAAEQRRQLRAHARRRDRRAQRREDHRRR